MLAVVFDESRSMCWDERTIYRERVGMKGLYMEQYSTIDPPQVFLSEMVHGS